MHFYGQVNFTDGDFFGISTKVGKNSNSKTRRVIDEATSSDSKYFKMSSSVAVAEFR